MSLSFLVIESRCNFDFMLSSKILAQSIARNLVRGTYVQCRVSHVRRVFLTTRFIGAILDRTTRSAIASNDECTSSYIYLGLIDSIFYVVVERYGGNIGLQSS